MGAIIKERSSERVQEEVEKYAIRRALERIILRSPRAPGSFLKVVEYGPPETDAVAGTGPRDDNLYLDELRPKRGLFGSLRKPQCRTLLTCSGLFHTSTGKEMRCIVHDSSILDLVKEEMRRCAEELQATSVDLSLDFC